MIIRTALFALSLLLSAASPSLGWEGLYLDDNHGRLKNIVQQSYQTEEAMTGAINELSELVSVAEQRYGRNSVEVGILLLDIGEGTVRRALKRSGEQKTDGLHRGIRALLAGAPLLEPIEDRYADATVSRARGYFLVGQAYAALGEKATAEQTYRDALAVHWRRFGDAYWQLQVFEYLDEVLETPEERLKLARGRLKIAMGLFGSGHVETEAAEAMVRKALALGNSLGDTFDLARTEAERLADEGDDTGAYERLAQAMLLATTDADQRLLIARIKPSPFFMYADPEADRQIGWDEMQKRPTLTAYDAVATRFLVDNSLEPFTAEGRNILLTLISFVRETYSTGDKDLARYFCRLVPGYGYEYGKDGSVPGHCVATLDWAAWVRSMGDAGGAVSIIEIGLDLLNGATDKEAISFRRQSLEHLLSLEADYGSPDGFFRTYERVLAAGYEPRADFQLYAQLITDNAEGVDTLLSEALALGSGEELSPSAIGLMDKLALAGPAIARRLCTITNRADFELVRVSMCVAGGVGDELSLQAAADLLADKTALGEGVLMVSGAPMLAIAERGPIHEVMLQQVPALAPSSYNVFTPRQPSAKERTFLARPTTFEEFKASSGLDPHSDDDFDAAILADALQKSGRLDLARDWAYWGINRYEAADPPETIFTAYMAEDFSQATYEAGWRWLMLDYPILAEASFSDSIPDGALSYSRGARDIKAGSLEWERVIGAYHGRMLTRSELGDREGARSDALGLISYVQFILELQSFSRFETRELIARVARPVLAHALSLVGADDEPGSVDAAFRAIQLLANDGTAATVSRLGARLADVSAGLDELARRREDLLLAWRAETGSDDSAQADRAGLAADLDLLDEELRTKYPDYVELAGATVVPLESVRSLLAPGEVQLSYAVLDDAIAISAIGTDRSHFELVTLDREVLVDLVGDVRRGLEIRAGRLPLFRADAAHRLYQVLIQPIEGHLASGADKIIVMPDASIGSVPFSVLVTEDPSSSVAGDVKWLADRYVVSRIPSAGSLVLMRNAKRQAAEGGTFAGIGDPILEGDSAEFRGIAVSEIYSTRAGGVDLESLRALPRLTETADELRSIEALVAPSSGLMLLGESATETNVKSTALDRYAIVAFATHGLLAGELQGQQEPGLVLTPPLSSTTEDDGYLSSSEIAQLHLNAALVVLSACNTAAPGATGAGGLSGLAKSFFFAGARSLLVSHWSVETQSALELTTRMMAAHSRSAELGYASALSQAMKELRNDPGFQHPALWGPFEIVGN